MFTAIYVCDLKMVANHDGANGSLLCFVHFVMLTVNSLMFIMFMRDLFGKIHNHLEIAKACDKT